MNLTDMIWEQDAPTILGLGQPFSMTPCSYCDYKSPNQRCSYRLYAWADSVKVSDYEGTRAPSAGPCGDASHMNLLVSALVNRGWVRMGGDMYKPLKQSVSLPCLHGPLPRWRTRVTRTLAAVLPQLRRSHGRHALQTFEEPQEGAAAIQQVFSGRPRRAGRRSWQGRQDPEHGWQGRRQHGRRGRSWWSTRCTGTFAKFRSGCQRGRGGGAHVTCDTRGCSSNKGRVGTVPADCRAVHGIGALHGSEAAAGSGSSRPQGGSAGGTTESRPLHVHQRSSERFRPGMAAWFAQLSAAST